MSPTAEPGMMTDGGRAAVGSAWGGVSLWACAAMAAGLIAVAAMILLAMGRTPWCTCGTIKLWISDVWGPESSQHITDPYTLTHVTHGVLLYLLLSLVGPSLPTATRGVLAVAVECGWEIVENTDWLINRYRAATLALGYYGDSVVNSVGDILACGVGFALAARLPARVTIAIVGLLELGLTVWIRDSLLLEVVMLLHPMPAVKAWQLGG